MDIPRTSRGDAAGRELEIPRAGRGTAAGATWIFRGGGERRRAATSELRLRWRHYFERTDGLVFVVDSNDRDRMGEVRDELWRLLNEPQLIRVPVLVLANKQDLPGALSGSAVADALGLMAIRSRPWFIQATCATARPGPGLYGRDPSGIRDGLSWLAAATKGEVPTPALKRGRAELPDE